MMAKLKDKVCAYSKCDNTFKPRNGWHRTCGWQCAMDYTKEVKEKRAAKEKRKAVKEFKENDKSELIKVAQAVFNKYIRYRDAALGCISCGNTTRQMHAGHLKPVGSYGNLRFNEDNCHKQCSICNNHKSGNVGEYEKNLRMLIGDDRVDALDTRVVKSYDVDELKEIIDTYKQKIKDMVQ